MEPITFNKYFIKQTKGGDKCNVIDLRTIDIASISTIKDNQPLIQTYNCGFRVDSSHGDYSNWNGTIFIDIDSKKYPKSFDYNIFYKGLQNVLESYFYDNYYCMQTSASGNSLHIIFYFDCERTKDNFKKCEKLSIGYVRECCRICGTNFETIINTKDILDSCTKSIGQGIYISNHNIDFGFIDDKFFGSVNLDNVEIEEEVFTKTEVQFKSDKKVTVKDNIKNLSDYSYQTRWKLCWIIFNYYNFDYDKSWEVYNKIIPIILKNRKDYDFETLKKQFDRDYNSSKYKEYGFNSYLLEWCKSNLGFIYKIKKEFVPNTNIKLYEPDVVYELKENERLSDININWSTTKINHLFAGCGFGKTFMSKEYGDKNLPLDNMESIIDFVFGGFSNMFCKGVCVISPTKSINKDNFKGIDNWVIIDSDNNEENKEKYGTIKETIENNKNICTTWESFVMLKMYEMPFKYIIVDEIHTLYMYDYRLNSISNIKKYLNIAQGIKIVMTGTPSYETIEMDCYKIQVNKEITKINCDIVFYNEQFNGYMIKDIKEWIKDDNHYVLIFKDFANYKSEENMRKYYGIDCEMFNSNYTDNVEYILNNHNIRSQITMFSVYGQAGINLNIDKDKKVRIYILNDNGLGIVQYANRVRNKECIDKIIIPYQINKIQNSYKKLQSINVNDYIDEAERKINVLNSITYKFDLFDSKNKELLKLKYGFTHECLDKIGNLLSLNITNFDSYIKIQNVLNYERQIQVIYNRLIQNYIIPNLIYLDEDVIDDKKTKLRSNVFAGKMSRFNFDMVKRNRNGEYWINADSEFKKICSGDLIKTIEDILNYLSTEPWNYSLEEIKAYFNNIVRQRIKDKGTITKSYFKMIRDALYYHKEFNNIYDNAFIIAMLDDDWDDMKLTAAYMRSKWNKELDDKDLFALTEEAYCDISRLKKIVNEFKSLFENKEVTKMTIENDEITQKIYNYLLYNHTKGKKGGKKGKKVIIDGVVYDTVKDAAEQLGCSRKHIYSLLKKQ